MNMHLSTLNIGLWWESDIIDALRLLHYQCGMPASMIITDIINNPPPAGAANENDVENAEIDWRSRNKATSGLLNQTAIYTPSLVFKKETPEWAQHWLIHACGKSVSND